MADPVVLESLCHLGDSAEMVLQTRPRPKPLAARPRPVVKALGLWTPLRWAARLAHQPAARSEGRRHAAERVRERRGAGRAGLAGLAGLASARPEALEPVHGVFGPMTLRDWQRWAYKHTDHHLRQFGR